MKVLTVSFALEDESGVEELAEALTELAESEDIHLLEYAAVRNASKREIKLAQDIGIPFVE
jgi:uncharacterized membrane protein